MYFKLNIDSKAERIYHYTSPTGFLNIIKSKSLWFSDINYLNDRGEIEYGISKILDFIKEIKIDKDDKAINYFLEVLEKNLLSLFLNVYVCCFSKNSDSLPMWNYYLKNNVYEGYNIGFKTNNLRDINGWITRIIEVIYNENEQRDLFLNLLKQLSDCLKKGDLNDEEKRSFKLELFYLIVCIKNPCFIHENEVRIVCSVNSLSGTAFNPFYRKSNNGIIVPYIVLPNPIHTLIKAKMFNDIVINVAPLMKFDLAERSIRSFLFSNGIKNAKIIKSLCPIRY